MQANIPLRLSLGRSNYIILLHSQKEEEISFGVLKQGK